MSRSLPWDDPAQVLLRDKYTSEPEVYRQSCYICRDPEFAQMGLPLCKKCKKCGGHIPADDTACDDCGFDLMSEIEENMPADEPGSDLIFEADDKF